MPEAVTVSNLTMMTSTVSKESLARDTHTHTDTDTDRQTQTQTDRQTDRQTDSGTSMLKFSK